jgi:hypothetical protein
MNSPSDIRWSEYVIAYVPTILTWIVASSLLALPKYSIYIALLQATLLLIWSYAGHVLAHLVSSAGPLSILNPHVYLHHEKAAEIPRSLELVIESVVNFMGFFFIFILQKLTEIELFSPSMIIGAALLYITVHILDYSIVGNINHRLHHAKTYCNYDPEFMDTLFGTRCEPEKPYTNMMWEIPHAIMAFAVASAIKVYFDLD